MSSNFNQKSKSLSGLKVVDTSEVWINNPKTGKKNMLNPALDIYGKVDTRNAGMVTKANKDGKKAYYVDDVDKLPKSVKQSLVDHFHDNKGNRNKKVVAYVARTDDKSKTSADNKNKLKNTGKSKNVSSNYDLLL